jgi:hypothetical protein
MPTHTHIPKTIAGLLLFTALSATAADLRGHSPPIVSLLNEFRPIGGAGNNLQNPQLNPVPYTPELSLTPLNFAPGTNDGLVNGTNPRTISNVISGGTGANGQNGQTTDPVASAWLYVSGNLLIMTSTWKKRRSPRPQSISSCRRVIHFLLQEQ